MTILNEADRFVDEDIYAPDDEGQRAVTVNKADNGYLVSYNKRNWAVGYKVATTKEELLTIITQVFDAE